MTKFPLVNAEKTPQMEKQEKKRRQTQHGPHECEERGTTLHERDMLLNKEDRADYGKIVFLLLTI